MDISFCGTKEGACEYAVKPVAREIQNAGYNRVIIKNDQEPALKELLQAVKRERAEWIEFAGIGEEESAVGESQSNGLVERAIQDVQAQTRTIKMALEWRYGGEKIKEEHPILPWLIRYSAMLINITRKGEDGRTAYERRRGKRYLRTAGIWGMYMVFETRIKRSKQVGQQMG